MSKKMESATNGMSKNWNYLARYVMSRNWKKKNEKEMEF